MRRVIVQIPLMLELVQATTYPDGAALHVYRPARQAF
jgi:hypothetical protein